MPKYLMCLVLTGVLLAGCNPGRLWVASRSQHTRVYVPGVGELSRGEAEKYAREIEDGPRALALQRAAARREGIPLTPNELQATLPPPEQNAATIYIRLTRLLKEKPLDPRTDKARGSVGVRVAHRPEDLQRVRKLLAERQDVMERVHAAVRRPRCVFKRDYTQGMNLMFREYAPMREVARLLTAESYFLAREGRYREAIKQQGSVFRVAEHTLPEPILIGHLVGMACDAIALAGMENILSLAGPDAAVAQAVRDTVAARRPRWHLRRALEGEVVMFSVMMQGVRRARSTAEQTRAFPGEEDRTAGGAGTPPGGDHVFTSAEQQIRGKALDVVEADYLEQMRQLIGVIDKPYRTQQPILKRFAALDRTPSPNVLHHLGDFLLPTLAQASTHEVRARAQEEVIMAAAAVLAHPAHTGALPARLEQALPVPPTDPFSGQPLKYRREAKGFVVYSVGPDGQFDGGKPGAPRVRDQAYFRYPATPQPPDRK